MILLRSLPPCPFFFPWHITIHLFEIFEKVNHIILWWEWLNSIHFNMVHMRNIKILIRNNLLCLTDHKFYSQGIAYLAMKYPVCILSVCILPGRLVELGGKFAMLGQRGCWFYEVWTCLVPCWLCPAWAAEACRSHGTITELHSCSQNLSKCCCGASKHPAARASPAPRLLSLSQSQLIPFSSQGPTLKVLAQRSVSPSPSLEWGQCLHPRVSCEMKNQSCQVISTWLLFCGGDF